MSGDKTNAAELDYIVWQYLQKEAPSLATEFRKLKNIKAKGGAKVTLASIYDIYTKNKQGTAKRQINANNSSVNKKQRLHQDENISEEADTAEINEKKIDTSIAKDQNNKEDIKSVTDEKEKENSNKVTKSADDKKPLLNNLPSEDTSGKKAANENSKSDDKTEKKPLLPKPKSTSSKQRRRKKKPLLAAPIPLLYQNDPYYYDTRKPLLPGLVPTIGPSGRKTLLIEPLHSVGRIERKPLLSDLPMSAYSEDDRIRRTLLTEPSQLYAPDERARKPLLMEPVPPPLMRESVSRIDRRALLADSPPLTRSYTDSSERIALLSHPSISDELNVLYRRERKSLLDEPPTSVMLQDFLKRKEKESLLMDPSLSEHYYDNRDRKAGLLSELPLSLGIEDNMNRKKRTLLSNRSPPLPRREYEVDPIIPANSSDNHLYSRKEASSLPKSLPFPDTQEYDDSSHLYTRRTRTKESTSDTANWQEKGALLAELEKYLKKHLSRSSEKKSNTTERNSLLAKPVDIQNYEVEKSNRISDPSRLSPDSYSYYMREKNALMARKDYFQVFPDSFNFDENARANKSGIDSSIRKEKASRKEEVLMPVSTDMRNYEESLKSIDYDYNSELSRAYRRVSEKEFRSLDRDEQRRPYERFSGKKALKSDVVPFQRRTKI